MPGPENLERRLERALSALGPMHRDGMLPPVLVPLLALAPKSGTRVNVELDRTRDGDGFHVSFSEDPARCQPRINSTEPLRDLLAVQMEAEENPQLHFVALKFLRDRLLPQSRFAWAQSPQTCQTVLVEAIDRGLLHTSKKPNPRNPSFPVTAVELNHDHEMVRELVAKVDTDTWQRAEAQAEAELPASAQPEDG